MKRRDLFRTLGMAGAAGALTQVDVPALAALPNRIRPRPRSSDLEARLAAAIAKHKVPGASAAVFQNGTLETAAVGVTNVVSAVPMTTDTIMHIGSITKVFNATLVMQLVDEGKVALDAPLKRYLPDFRLADPDTVDRITVGMLLNHTSGIDGEIFPDGGHDHERIVDALPRIARQGQIHPPGAELSYCNSAVVLAGHIVEQLTGKSWYDVVVERIFRPLEMRNAVVLPEDALLHRATVGHFLNPSTQALVRTSFAFLPLSFAPAGATAMMSATDLVIFARAHINGGVAPNGHRLLSAASAAKMQTLTATWRGVGFADVGLGWLIVPGGVVMHSGGGPGILSTVYAHPASQTVVAILTNAAHGNPVMEALTSPLLTPLGSRTLGGDTAEFWKRATDAPVDPKPYLGQFESLATAERIVPHRNGIAIRVRARFKIYDGVTTEESEPVPLRPIGDGKFALGPSVITFLSPGADGRMTYMARGGRLIRRIS